MERNERIEGQLTLRLDQESIQRLGELAGQKSMTAGELIESFINDLTHGPYSNGSDERMKAEDWIERSTLYWSDSLLKYLTENGISVDRRSKMKNGGKNWKRSGGITFLIFWNAVAKN